MSGSLFEDETPSGPAADAPLADRMRPQTLDDVIGQGHLLDTGKPLRTAIEHDQAPSMILWGPPGVGKTTLAQIIAKMTKSTFVPFSAVLAGIKEIKEVMVTAEKAPPRAAGEISVDDGSAGERLAAFLVARGFAS